MASPYETKVLSYSPIAYWALNETTGAAAVNQGTLGATANGTAVAVAWDNMISPDGVNGAPYFDGATSYGDIMTAPLVAAWDAGGAEWSIMLWWRVYELATWTDGASRVAMSCLDTSADYVMAYKTGTANTFRDCSWRTGAVPESRTSTISEVPWQCTAATHSETDDKVIYYRNGNALETDTALGVWGSATPWDRMLIGASTAAPIQVWHGWLAHVAFWDSVLT